VNVIVICLDTFRADLVGEGENLRFVETPCLDQLAKEGVRFVSAYGEGQPTLQARRSFFTGMRSFPWRFNFDRRGHWHHAPGWHKIPPDHDTLAEILCARGYFTGLVSDTMHLFKPTMNYTRGFCTWDFVRGQIDDTWRGGTPRMVAEQMARHVRKPINWRRHVTLMQYLLNNRHRQSEEDYLPARVMTSAAQWLEDNHGNAPFFLWVDVFDPHEPWDPPKSYADRYMPGHKGMEFIMPSLGWEHGEPTEEEKGRMQALYFGEVSLVDKWIGHLVETVDRLKLRDDTIFVVTSDHGAQVGDNGGMGKSPRDLRSYNTRILLLIRHPDGPRGHFEEGFVQAHDLASTLCGMLGIPFIGDGRDFWPMAVNGGPPVRDHVVIGWAQFSRGRACGYASVRDSEWNYCVGTGFEDPEPKLYHLTKDPGEKTNVVGKYPEVVALQRRRIEAILRQPLPGKHEEMCGDARSPLHICADHWFHGEGGPALPSDQ